MWEPNAPLPTRVAGTGRQRLRPAGARRPAGGPVAAARPPSPTARPTPTPSAPRTIRRARSAASSSTCPAGRRTSICSIPSRGWPPTTASRCRSRSRSSSAPRPATCSPRRGSSPSTASRGIEVSELLPRMAVVHRRHLRDPLDGRRQHQPHRRRPADVHRRAGVLAAEHGLVAGLRPGHREPEPARLRGRQPRRGLPGGAALGVELPAQRLPGDARSATSKNPIANLADPVRRPRTAARQARRARPAQRAPQARPGDRQPARRPHRVVRAGVPHAAGSARGVRHLARERRDAAAVRDRRPDDRPVRPAVPAGPAAGRSGACASSSSSTPRRTTPGTSTAACARTCPSAAPRSTSRSPRC